LEFFLLQPAARAFHQVEYDVEKAVSELWPSAKTTMLELLLKSMRKPETKFAKQYLSAISSRVSGSEFEEIAFHHMDAIHPILTNSPRVAAFPEVWKLPEHIQWRAFETLENLDLPPQFWSKILSAMFVTATNVGVKVSVAKSADYAIDGAFEWLNQDIAERLLPSQVWREALSEAAAHRFIAAKLSPPEFAFCFWLMEPHVARKMLAKKRLEFGTVAKGSLQGIPTPLRTYLAFAFVTLGLQLRGEEGLFLFSKGFFDVYEALASKRYTPDSWLMISSELPKPPAWKEWDRCARLRKATKKRFDRDHALQILLSMAASPLRRDILRETFDLPDDFEEE
jgi:hypothetical protein